MLTGQYKILQKQLRYYFIFNFTYREDSNVSSYMALSSKQQLFFGLSAMTWPSGWEAELIPSLATICS